MNKMLQYNILSWPNKMPNVRQPICTDLAGATLSAYVYHVTSAIYTYRTK